MLILPPGYRSQATVGFSRPERNEEMERQINAQLAELDELLFLFWMPTAFYNPRHREFEGRYALAVRWPQSDKRWEMYRRGEIGEAFDILGWFNTDMHDASSIPQRPDEIWNRAVELLGKADNTRESWKHRMKRVAEANIENKRKMRQEFLENEVHDIASYYRNEGLDIQQVNVPAQIGEK